MLLLLPERQDVQSQIGKGFSHSGTKVPRKLPLREHRLRAGVPLAAISDTTKLSRRFLEAIEEGDYGELPGGVFAVNYIRQYADATGYDADLILEHYRQSSGLDKPAGESKEARPSALRWGKFVLFG
jgi:cytoskeletal protein RodZ